VPAAERRSHHRPPAAGYGQEFDPAAIAHRAEHLDSWPDDVRIPVDNNEVLSVCVISLRSDGHRPN
jgi:hypothetical protein